MKHEEALRKAMSCLRLAKSANEAEAALAAAKAQEIITKYNLDITDADFDANSSEKDNEPINDFGNDPVDHPNGYDVKWAMRLCSQLAHQNGCKIYYEKLWDRPGRALKIIGRASDVNLVRYLYAYFKNEVKRLQKENCKGNSVQFKVDYCAGVTLTLCNRLYAQSKKTEQEIKAQHANNERALVRVNNALAKMDERLKAVDAWAEENANLKPGRTIGNTREYRPGMEAGRRDGHKVRLTSSKGSLGASRKEIAS